MNENFLNEYKKIIVESNILLIGSGGIGCELLKSLVISGFKKISIIDLDQIEKSNLNRQFLFRKTDIGKNKAEIAKLNILKYRPDEDLDIKSYVGNIKDTENFGWDFFSKFDIVLNALDNIDARTHVNRMCNILDIPLVNSGSEGYLGNVQTSLKNITPCYNCLVKNNSKVIPICTIRSKPETIEHCVAWAKNLFEILYTKNENSSFLVDEKLSENNNENLLRYFYKYLLDEHKLNEKIVPIDINQFNWIDKNYQQVNEEIHLIDNEKFHLDFYIFILISSNEALESYIKSNGKFEKFDKENNDIINFVFAASNLRAHNFNLIKETRFKIKEIAGNIVPAIASTNAIIASLQTIEAIKVLTKNKELLKNLHYNKTKEIKSTTAMKEEINKQCIICSKCENYIYLTINIFQNDLNFFINEISKKQLNVSSPEIYFEKDFLDDEFDKKLLNSPLSNWIKNNSIIKIKDEKSDNAYTIIFFNDEKLKNNQYEIKFKNASEKKKNEGSKIENSSLSYIKKENKKEIKTDKYIEKITVDLNSEDNFIDLSEERSCLGHKRKHDDIKEDYIEIIKKI